MVKKFIPIISLISSVFLLNYNLNRLLKHNSKISILFFAVEVICIYSIARIFTKISNEHSKIKEIISEKSELFFLVFWSVVFASMTAYFLYKNNLILDINIYTLACIVLVLLSFLLRRININIYYLLSILFLIGFIPSDISNIKITFFSKSIKLIDFLYSTSLLTSTFSMMLRIISRYLFK